MFMVFSDAKVGVFSTSYSRLRFVRVVAAFVALLLVAIITVPASAQLSGTGAITGTVADDSGAVIPGATVTATAVTTNAKTVRTTTGAGDYNITPLTPGVYTVSVTANGFQQHVQQNITVDALATVSLNVKMEIGQSTETVTVSSAPPLLSTTDATLGAVMDNEMYSSLPILMGQGGNNDQRRATDFEYLMPGVQNNYTSNNSTDNSGIINGSGPAGGVSEIYIDGVNLPEADQVGDPRFTWSAIGVDAINQFQVQTAAYSAQYAGQGVENFSIKQGGNAFHGSLYEYLRNTVLDAWNFTNKVPTANSAGVLVPGGIKPKEIQNEFGIVLSGPIVKDKLFLFVNYGQYRNQNGPRFSNITLPTAAMIGYTQTGQTLGYADFTAYVAANPGYNIYDPATQTPNCQGTAASPCSRTQIMGMKNGIATANVIPGNRISTAANYINQLLSKYEPQVNQSLYSSNFPAGQPFGLANWYDTQRLDYNQSSRHQISFIVAFGRQSSTGLNSIGNGQLGPPFNTSQSYHPVTTVNVVKDVFTISPHLVNQFSIGYARYQSVSVSPDDAAQYTAAAIGLTGNVAASGSAGLPAGQAAGGFPELTFTGGPSGTAPAQQAGYSWNSKVNNTYTVTDSVQWVLGKHNVNIGGQVVEAQFNYYKALGPTGPADYGFSSAQTAQFSSNLSTSTASTSGSPIASYDLGAVNSGSILNAAVPGLGTRWLDPSFWAQDDWKLNEKLTLNLGLRWDIFPSIHEAHNIFSYLNPTGINSVTGNRGVLEYAGSSIAGASCNCKNPAPTNYGNVAPRIGGAYAIDGKTVVRGSYDLIYARGDWTSGSQSGSPSTTGFTPSATAAAGISSAPAFYWDNTPCNLSPATNDGVACGFTGSIAAPTAPAGGTSLAEYLTTETSVLGNGGSGTVTYFSPHYGAKTPQFSNWTFGIQRSITKDMSLTLTYVGSQGHFISSTKAIGANNNELPETLAGLAGYNLVGTVATPCSGAACYSPVLSAKATAANLGVAQTLGFTPPNPYTTATYYASNSVYQYYQPYPQYSGVSDTTSFVGNTNFHALEVILRERQSHGVDFMVNYTYSKSIDDVGTFRVGDNPRLDRSLSTTDQPQNLTATAVYVSPYGKRGMKSSHFLVNALARDWNVSGIFVYHSGNPLVSTGTGCGGSGILNQCMPSIVAGQAGRQYQYNKDTTGHTVTAANYSSIQYVNPNAFTVASAGTTVVTNGVITSTNVGTQTATTSTQATYVGNGPALYIPGNAPRVAPLGIFGMSAYDVDLAIKRSFPIREKVSLQLEADMANATNHVVFSTPSGAANGSGLGEIGSVANTPRAVQLAGRISW